MLAHPLVLAATTLSLRRPSRGTLERYSAKLDHAARPLNHGFAQTTLETGYDDEAPPGLRAIRYRCSLGRGGACYRKAAAALLSWQMHAGSTWSGVHCGGGGGVGAQLVTYAALGPAWVINPCRVVHASRGRRRSTAAYATLSGHLLAGTERMSVAWREDGAVEFEVLSLSRGAGPLGRLLFTGLARTQRRFFREQLACMETLVRAQGGSTRGVAL